MFRMTHPRLQRTKPRPAGLGQRLPLGWWLLNVLGVLFVGLVLVLNSLSVALAADKAPQSGPILTAAPPPGPLALAGPLGSNPTIPLNVSNSGGRGSSLSISLGSITPGFAVLGLPITNLAASASASLSIGCIPTTNQQTGQLVLATNDPARPSLAYNLSCSALVPALDSTTGFAGPLAFSGPVGQTQTGKITVQNDGQPGSQLVLALSFVSEGFSVSGLPLTINQGSGSASIAVSCTPSTATLHKGNLVLATNDPTQVTITYPLSCQGQALQVDNNPQLPPANLSQPTLAATSKPAPANPAPDQPVPATTSNATQTTPPTPAITSPTRTLGQLVASEQQAVAQTQPSADNKPQLQLNLAQLGTTQAATLDQYTPAPNDESPQLQQASHAALQAGQQLVEQPLHATAVK